MSHYFCKELKTLEKHKNKGIISGKPDISYKFP